MEFLQGIVNKAYQYRRKIATAAIGFVAVSLAFHVIFGANGMMQYRNKRAEYQQIQNEVRQLQDDNARLEQGNRALKTDPKTIEKEAREQFGYTRPGEHVYVMPAVKPEMSTARASKK